ncbi:MAG TPA: protease [Fibrobacteres bacterium]|jgi:protease I|nr:protease [Fibrobacterota bacterium]
MAKKKILIITGDGGETYETLFAKHRFMEAGYEPVIAGPTKKRMHLVIHDFEPGWDTYKERPGYEVVSDTTFDKVKIKDYVAVLCIGGRAPEYLRNDKKCMALIKEGYKLGLWHFSICHGLQLSAAAGITKGKKVTCYENIRHEVDADGAFYQKQEAVRDGLIVSGQTWNSHPEFYQLVFQCLNEKKKK